MENLKLADLEKENQQYLRKDISGGILSDKEQIEYYKTEQYVNVVDNLMLGNYNELGVYEIETDIIVELINCRKIVNDSYENILFVNSIKPINVFSTISFAVRITNGDSPSFKYATLELLEPIYKANGMFENTQATVLKKISLRNDENFRSEVFSIFNIIPKDSDANARTEFKEDENEFEKTLMRKIQLLYIKNKIQEEQQKQAEICYKKNIKELEKTISGKEIIAKTQNDETILNKYMHADKNDYKARNEILKTNIEQSGFMTGIISKNVLTANSVVIDVIKNISKISNSLNEKKKTNEKKKQKTNVSPYNVPPKRNVDVRDTLNKIKHRVDEFIQ